VVFYSMTTSSSETSARQRLPVRQEPLQRSGFPRPVYERAGLQPPAARRALPQDPRDAVGQPALRFIEAAEVVAGREELLSAAG